MFKSGFVAIVGRPNAGKSTLMDRFLGSELSIVTSQPQTTRNSIKGIYTTEEEQIVFIDTPGIHKPKDLLGEQMDDYSYQSFKDADVILYVVDASVKLGKGEQYVIDKLNAQSVPVILVLNKIDLIHPDTLLSITDYFHQHLKYEKIIPLSAVTGQNFSELPNEIIKFLPVGEPLFNVDDLSDKPTIFFVAELVRKAILELTSEEIPHASAVEVLDMSQFENGKRLIEATIYVERDSQKKIIIGSKGSMIKNIGIHARKQIEELLGEKVNLKLWVKKAPKWRNTTTYLNSLGYRKEKR
ncbi:GTPase Era [Xylocopilactobacillus apicola]|uniref:GTPase Era n=1 Tax=Xylocopilactobacillus apicola TaxID=2932184 RepID=A0AAU9CX99_9LACO|nr:GTPase Era [Xylocopilactobacillus apicola]